MPLGMCVDGKWVIQERDRDEQGRFNRTPTTFRGWVSADGASGFAPEPGRYHLYISWACPWAHRTAIFRKLKGLEEAIGLSVVHPVIDRNGWEFADYPGAIPDPVHGAHALWEIYTRTDAHYTGKVTVPVLYDKKTEQIVNNESRQIVRMFESEFDALARHPGVNFYPQPLREAVDRAIDAIYGPINNGVYRSGFATTQEAYEEAVSELFEALDRHDDLLSKQRYLCGDWITEADWFLFTTLYRFDPVYYVHFKCNLRRIAEYPNLWNYLKELYQYPGVAETCHPDHIKRHYYMSHTNLNPHRIVPKGPLYDLSTPHDRGRLAAIPAAGRG
jgi:putative glutathione S-transferase